MAWQGGRTVYELSQELSHNEREWWVSYFMIHPPEDLYLANAIVAATVANCHRDPKKSKPLAPKDFMPTAYQPPQTTAHAFKALRMWMPDAANPPKITE